MGWQRASQALLSNLSRVLWEFTRRGGLCHVLKLAWIPCQERRSWWCHSSVKEQDRSCSG